jgi:16S rRNA (guanine966-N2)-methyltransferase
MPSRPHDRQGRPERTPARAGPRLLRIIGGQWRGRRLRFPAGDIRPTPDRVRETLFNWLQQRVVGARCLDLFAGSGALGLEALSRGAAAAVFVERDRAAAQALRATLAEWHRSSAPERDAPDHSVQVHCLEAERYLRTALAAVPPTLAFDLVFLDPPYVAVAQLTAVTMLLERGLLRPGGLVYMEHARRDAVPPLPAAWRELRTGTAGEVGYHLFEAAAEGGQ